MSLTDSRSPKENRRERIGAEEYALSGSKITARRHAVAHVKGHPSAAAQAPHHARDLTNQVADGYGREWPLRQKKPW